MIQINEKITFLKESVFVVLVVDISANDVGKMLALIDALDSKRIHSFSIVDNSYTLIIRSCEDGAIVELNDFCSFQISKNQMELIRFCFMDRLLGFNPDPWVHHVDLQCGDVDFTVSITVPNSGV